MAEFKLGRIRFIWKGDWTPTTIYYKDDIVRNGGNTYVCISGHTAPSLFTTDQSEYWNKISDGFEWKADWTVETYYKVNDVVKYGGYLYIANEAHTSADNTTDGLELDQAKWDLFAEGFDYKADWITSNRYKINDIAKYNGTIYVCTQEHTSLESENIIVTNASGDGSVVTLNYAELSFAPFEAGETITVRKISPAGYNGTFTVVSCTTTSVTFNSAETGVFVSSGYIVGGVEHDLDKWDIFSEGFYWRNDAGALDGTWTPETRYKKNDIVKYGGTVYVCNTGHLSAETDTLGLEDDQNFWDYYHKGIEYKGDWTTSIRYKINDVVKYGGGIWICTEFHTSQTYFTDDEAKWDQFVEGLEFEDSWNDRTRYQPGDFVTYGGYSYVSVTNNQNKIPTQYPADWDLFTTGFRFLGDYNVDPEDLQDSTSYEYKVGDVVRLGGYTYLCIDDHFGQRPPNADYWERLNSGIFWKEEWQDDVYYDAGDTVTYTLTDTIGGSPVTYTNTYICVQEHTSDETVEQNRPDQDLTGEYWDVLAGGPEIGNLTTEGDIVYYSGAGPTRLPIGTPGQLLKVNDAGNAPEWAYFGQVNNTFYVEGGNGVDEPAPDYGITLDRPFKTIRYASEQILKGALRYNSKTLLELNRSFIQAETVEWIDYQIANNISPFTTGFTYDKETYRIDIGKLVDALIYDLSHGGTDKSVQAALAYFSEGSLVSHVAGKATETVAAIEYAVIVMDAVLTNFAPAANYQSLNGVGSPITQQINANLVEESDAQTLVETLTAISTDAITAGNTTGVPAGVIPQNTIFVKTGQFSEVLPIIVPENTAVVGDELRSTRISPAGSLVDSADTPYSIAAIERLADIIDNIVVNNTAGWTKTTTETQVTTRPAGSANVGAIASDLATQIRDYINWGVNGASGDSTEPEMTGSNTPQTTTEYTYAVEVIEANREFIKDEIIAWIADTYPGYSYDEAKCRRDIDRYLDAIKYDIIYTGNYKSLMYAKYYVNAVNGSTAEDMFYLRNGTGLRNCTVIGLSGTLSSNNIYGTKRPTAGAYCSLDPGWGPDDESVWIINKSPYVQNVTTFGDGCIGCKIDGNLHNGGNDSIVANDFTQLVSDGIGVWCTNLGRTELVSVFSYYAHIGYLAENGGKIRATNGNSSYGEYGTVAEGVDDTEVPISGTVDNQAFDAVVQRVMTNGSQILVLEYLNAGVNYSTATDAITEIDNISAGDPARVEGIYTASGTSDGAGTGQSFEILISDLGVATITILDGGSGHVAGDVITISDSDLGNGGAADLTFEIATAGDATVITPTGEGFGAAIDSVQTVDGGVFEVRLLDAVGAEEELFGGEDFFTTENVAQGGTATSITLSNTDPAVISSQYEGGGTGTGEGIAVFITSGKGAGQYGYIDSFNVGTKIANIKKFSDDTAGWDHVVPGTAIETSLDDTTNYSIEPRISFAAPPSGLYADTAKGRAIVEDGKIVRITLFDPGEGYVTAPTMTVIDPNNTQVGTPAEDLPHEVRIGDGVLTQPTWTNRGTGFATAQADVTGVPGYADLYQPGTLINVKGLTDIPQAGSNVTFDTAGLTGEYFKLVAVLDLLGIEGNYTARLQVSPAITITDAPNHNTPVEMRIRYSQVRLTGHDFLDIGTGNFANTNYPGIPSTDPDPEDEIREGGGGRVFYTSTDQDGNFRVGRLFNVEQSTGVATLNAEAFNISGLQELQLGNLELGGTGAVINEFSTDGTFTANSDNIVPTQKAIRTYIQSQIGGGAGELNVNSITAGSILINTDQITTTTGNKINILETVNYAGGISGSPVALNYFLLG